MTLLQYQKRLLANAFAQARTRAPIAFPILLICATALFIYECASTYASLAACSACAAITRTHPAATRATWLCVCTLAGIAAAVTATRHLAAIAASSWLAPLPWSASDRRRAIAAASAAQGAALALILATSTWAAASGLRLHDGKLLALSAAAASGAGFAAATWPVLTSRRTNRPPPPPATTSRARWTLGALDRPRPANASRWALAGRTRLIACAWVISLLTLAPALAAASLSQHQTTTALAIATAGANAIFVLALRCHPLASPALRATPLTYTRATAAMCRVPMTLSVAWFAFAALVPTTGDRIAWQTLPAMLAALLLCNTLYAATAIARPTSPRQAILLYAAGLYAIFYEAASAGPAYSALALLAVCAIAAVLARHARQHYRAYHG